MSTLAAEEARRRFAGARVARLGTIDLEGRRPHLVPVVFAVSGDTVFSAVDAKPKRSTALRRLANVGAEPGVSLLADHYVDDDWAALWWVRADGEGQVLAPDDPAARVAVDLLTQKYPQHAATPPTGPVLAVEVRRWSGWAAR